MALHTTHPIGSRVKTPSPGRIIIYKWMMKILSAAWCRCSMFFASMAPLITLGRMYNIAPPLVATSLIFF